jgi:hypothetical protein
VSPPSADDSQLFVDWCVGTGDLMAFRRVLGRLSDERWNALRRQIGDSVIASRPTQAHSESNAAAREQRARAVARDLKIEIMHEVTSLRERRARQ